MSVEFEIYKGKSFQALCQDIVEGRDTRRDQIELLISELRPLIKNVNDAMVIVPLIKGYLDTSNTNDGNIVRLAAIIQKIISSSISGNDDPSSGGFISEEEKKQLMQEAEVILKDQTKINPIKPASDDVDDE